MLVSDCEDQGVDVKVFACSRRPTSDLAVFAGQLIVGHRELGDAPLRTWMNCCGRAEEAEPQARRDEGLVWKFLQGGEGFVSNFANVLSDYRDAILHALEFLSECLAVEVLMNMSEFLVVKLGLERTTPRDHHNLVRPGVRAVEHEPARNIHHYVAHADDGDPLANGEILCRKWWQQVVVINIVFRGIDAGGIFSWHAQLLRPLRAHGEDHCRGFQLPKGLQRYWRFAPDGHVAKVVDIGQR